MTTTQQLKRLFEVKVVNYRASGDSHPEVVAKFAVEGIMAMYRDQPQYLEQLLDEEIEDAIKAGEKLVA
ncbi:MAG: hypothetical protein DDT31_00028 [Syntrophomonadaceae bacterium]|nr:hypothetical protein [Bacillota bacterium]